MCDFHNHDSELEPLAHDEHVRPTSRRSRSTCSPTTRAARCGTCATRTRAQRRTSGPATSTPGARRGLRPAT